MREILFRGKNRDGVWLYGDLRQNANAIETDGINLGGDTFIEPHEYGDTCYSPDYYAVNPDTVGEYTGLTDRNGVRIFEGDIVETNGHAFEIAYRECGFQLLVRRENSLYGFIGCGDMFAVIGNVHDNPSFLNA